jgi:hypothetical protein
VDQDSLLLEDLANLATLTVPNVQDLLTDVLHVLVVSLLMPLLLSVFQSHNAPMVKTSAAASVLTSVTKDSIIMKESASMVAASQATSPTLLEDVSDNQEQLLLREETLLLATKISLLLTVNVLVHAQVDTMVILTQDNVLHAPTTVLAASIQTSVSFARVVTKQQAEFAAPQVLALITNSNTMEFASTHAQSELHLQALDVLDHALLTVTTSVKSAI